MWACNQALKGIKILVEGWWTNILQNNQMIEGWHFTLNA
jgi:hypothetical protein